MAPVKIGTQTYADPRACELAVRKFMDQHVATNGNYSTVPVDAALVEGWLRPLLQRHPRAAQKMKDWDGVLLIQKFMTGACLFLVKTDGAKDNISVKACATGVEKPKRAGAKRPEQWVPSHSKPLDDDILEQLWK